MLTWNKYPDIVPDTTKEVLVRTDENTYKICKYMKNRNTFDTYFIVTHWQNLIDPKQKKKLKNVEGKRRMYNIRYTKHGVKVQIDKDEYNKMSDKQKQSIENVCGRLKAKLVIV